MIFPYSDRDQMINEDGEVADRRGVTLPAPPAITYGDDG